MFERMEPKTLLTWLIIAAVVYLLLPYDFLPDFLGLPGRLDDFLVMLWLAWVYRNHSNQFAANANRASAAEDTAGANPRKNRQTSHERPATFDPYEVLGVTRDASRDAIRSAYRDRMKEYHPDKVAHLGQELQALAKEKAQQIQRAYQELSG